METSKNEKIKSTSLMIIDDIKDVLVEIQDDEIEIDEATREIDRLLNTLKRGIEKIS